MSLEGKIKRARIETFLYHQGGDRDNAGMATHQIPSDAILLAKPPLPVYAKEGPGLITHSLVYQ